MDVGARDRADVRDVYRLSDLGVTEQLLAVLGREHALHRRRYLLDALVDDAVRPYLNSHPVRHVERRLVRADVEADYNGV